MSFLVTVISQVWSQVQSLALTCNGYRKKHLYKILNVKIENNITRNTIF